MSLILFFDTKRLAIRFLCHSLGFNPESLHLRLVRTRWLCSRYRSKFLLFSPDNYQPTIPSYSIYDHHLRPATTLTRQHIITFSVSKLRASSLARYLPGHRVRTLIYTTIYLYWNCVLQGVTSWSHVGRYRRFGGLKFVGSGNVVAVQAVCKERGHGTQRMGEVTKPRGKMGRKTALLRDRLALRHR
jgi:hypothetical protein